MSPLISTIISSLVPVFTDKLSKTAGSASTIYIVHIALLKLSQAYVSIIPWITTPEQLAYLLWAFIALILLITPSEWLMSKLKVLKYLMEQLGRKS